MLAAVLTSVALILILIATGRSRYVLKEILPYNDRPRKDEKVYPYTRCEVSESNDFMCRFIDYSCSLGSGCSCCSLHSAEHLRVHPLFAELYIIRNRTRLRAWAVLAWRYGVRLISRGTSVRIRFGSPLSSKVAVCGHCPVTLSLTIMKY